MAWVVGIDTGGTFTDVFAANTATGESHCVKCASTPRDPSEAILTGLAQLEAQHGVALSELAALAHGTTVGTNALIQRSGGRVAVVTTRGFRDLLEIGRQTRPQIYDLQLDAPEPLADRQLRLEVEERVLSDGSVLRPLDGSGLPAIAETLKEAQVDSCAICFLFSYLNPEHERLVGRQLAALLPDLQISLSSAVQPEYREFERFNTTVINCHLQPVMQSYIDRLARELAAILPATARVGVNQSSGGLMTPETARAFPIRTALSGPAAGVVGAVHVARQTGRGDIMTVDVGGTSADVSLIQDYRPSVTLEREVAGFPIRLPMIDIHTIGAGGGSIAWFDRDGLLKVGPRSAGANPGPACYGLGGREPTVTDANLVLGRLAPQLADGGVALNRDLAVEALQPIAARLGWSIEKAALSVIDIVVSNMVRALRTISVEQGHDPADYLLMPFGGAGPLHARDIALELRIGEILMPAVPGIVCAQGLIVAEQREDFVTSRRIEVASDCMAAVEAEVATLDERVEAWFAGLDAAADACRRALVVDARYVGQNFELRVPLAETPRGEAIALPSNEALLERFFAEHEQAYGYANRKAAVEIVNLRLTGLVAGVALEETRLASAAGRPEPRGTRPVWFSAAGPSETAIYRRADLTAGSRLAGPAIVEQLDTTIPIHPGDSAEVDRFGNIMVRVAP